MRKIEREKKLSDCKGGPGTSYFLPLQCCSGMSMVRIYSGPMTMRSEKGLRGKEQSGGNGDAKGQGTV